MKVLRYLEPRKADVLEVPDPEVKGNMVFTKSLFCNISAGTEMGFYRGTAPQINSVTDEFGIFGDKKDAITYPMKSDDPGVWWMGYANVSEVLKTGPDVKELKKGDKVFGFFGHQDHQYQTEQAFTKLPEGINLKNASFLALVQICFNGILDTGIRYKDVIVIFGLGTLGQLLVQLAKKNGAVVIAVDGHDKRLGLAKVSGADHILDFRKTPAIAREVYTLTKGRGADRVIEVSGNVNALSEAVKCASYNGKVTVLSFYQDNASALALGREFHHKRTTIQSSQIGGMLPDISNTWDKKRRMETAVGLISELNLEPLISHKSSFASLPSTLQMIDKNPADCNAVIIEY